MVFDPPLFFYREWSVVDAIYNPADISHCSTLRRLVSVVLPHDDSRSNLGPRLRPHSSWSRITKSWPLTLAFLTTDILLDRVLVSLAYIITNFYTKVALGFSISFLDISLAYIYIWILCTYYHI